MRQERAARRARLAQAKANTVIEQAHQRVRQPQTAAVPRQRAGVATATATAGSSGSVDLAAECRRLRDQEGKAWWLIGKLLGLPGAGDSASTGKAGAHQARRLYASNGTAVPRTRAPRNGGVKKERGPGQQGSKLERKIALTQGTSCIPADYTDEQVVAYVAGRTIEWGINLNNLDGKGDQWLNQEMRVHPVYVIIDEDPDQFGGRVLRFREFLGYDNDQRSNTFGQPMGGQTKTVRVSAIHTVR